MTISITNYSALDGKYTVQGTIGSGGFGKVKKGIHVVTGEKVAIKVMDKRTLGDDLPRAMLEIEALKDLSHQNICQMYEVLETETKIFMILEHCSGGEMFDYIVERDRLEENEARFFFRQIVAAVAYIHSKGYAHRDLKPENLLLDEEQNIKLIDFGLCARPKGGMGVQLETFCGSPAYAAPELITGKEYLGSEVDIWSLGILLYTLLCGYLPFDDDNMGTLYRKIQSGSYECPAWLTEDTKDVINRMLQVEPKRRITVANLLEHPWISHSYASIQWRSVYFKQDLEDDVISELSLYFARSKKSIYDELRQWKYDYLMSTYFLLLQKKRKGHFLTLSHEETPIKMCQRINWELSSSLESGLNNAELLLLGSPKRNTSVTSGNVDGNIVAEKVVPNKLQVPVSKVREFDKENFVLPSCPPSSKKNRKGTKVSGPKIPVSARTGISETIHQSKESEGSSLVDGNQEVIVPIPAVSVQQNNEEKFVDKFHSPSLFAPIEKRCRSIDLDASGHAIVTKQKSVESGTSPALAVGTPTKSGSARHRVFGSIEKQMDRVRHMLTPKKKTELFPGPSLTSPAPTPRKIKVKPTGLYNVSVVGSSGSGRKSTSPEAVLTTLQKALESKGIPCNRKGYILRNKIQNEQTGKVTLAFELEICYLQPPSHGSSAASPDFPLIGVCRKRLKGDAWIYKNVVEEVLKVLNHIR